MRPRRIGINCFNLPTFFLNTFYRLYTSVEPLQQTLREVEDLMMYKNYQPAIDRLTEIVEVRIQIFCFS